MCDACIVIQKVKNGKNTNVIMNVGCEMFSTFDEAVSYIKRHFLAKRKTINVFENDDYVYQIHFLHKVKEYQVERDRLILEGGAK